MINKLVRPNEKKKKLYYIQLNGLETLGDPVKITQLLFKHYPHVLNENWVEKNQIEKNIAMIIKYITSFKYLQK